MANITLLGRIGREPEMRTTQGGMAVLSFPVADSKKVKGVEKTTWYDCAIFGARAEALQQYIRKGEQIYINGEHELDTWDKDDGTKGFKCKVAVSDVKLIGGQAAGQQPAQNQGFQQPAQGFNQQPQQAPVQGGFTQQPMTSAQMAPQAQQDDGGFDDFDLDIPF